MFIFMFDLTREEDGGRFIFDRTFDRFVFLTMEVFDPSGLFSNSFVTVCKSSTKFNNSTKQSLERNNASQKCHWFEKTAGRWQRLRQNGPKTKQLERFNYSKKQFS